MAPRVHIELTVGERNLMRRLRNVEGKLDKIKGKAKSAGKTGQSAFRGMSREMGNFVKTTVGPIAAITAIVTTAKLAYSQMKELNRMASSTIEKTVESRSKAILNIGETFGKGMDGIKKFDAMIANIQEKTGIGDRSKIYDISAAILSSQGEKTDVKAVESAITGAARLQKMVGDAFDTREIGAAAIMLRDAAGTRQIESIIGRMVQVQTVLPARTPEALIKTVPAIDVLVNKMGFTFDQAINRLAVAAGTSKDIELTKVNTALLALYGSIKGKKMFPKEVTDPRTGKKKTEWMSVGQAFGGKKMSLIEKERAVREKFSKSSEEVQNEMLSKIRGRSAIKESFYRTILEDTSANQKIIQGYADRLGTFNEKLAVKFFEDLIKRIESGLGKAKVISEQTKKTVNVGQIESFGTDFYKRGESLKKYEAGLKEARVPGILGIKRDFVDARDALVGGSGVNRQLRDIAAVIEFKQSGFFSKLGMLLMEGRQYTPAGMLAEARLDPGYMLMNIEALNKLTTELKEVRMTKPIEVPTPQKQGNPNPSAGDAN